MLPYDSQEGDFYMVFIDYAHTFCGLHELHDPGQYMVSVEMMLPDAGQKVDSYIVSIDSAQLCLWTARAT